MAANVGMAVRDIVESVSSTVRSTNGSRAYQNMASRKTWIDERADLEAQCSLGEGDLETPDSQEPSGQSRIILLARDISPMCINGGATDAAGYQRRLS